MSDIVIGSGALLAAGAGTLACAAVLLSDGLASRFRVPATHGLLGALLVAVPLPTVVAVRLAGAAPGPRDLAAFVLALAAFVAGALLLVAAAGGRGPDDGDPDEPPWWPEFEAGLRAYVRAEPPRPKARR